MQSAAQLANLRAPFERGNTISRMNKGRLSAVNAAARASPECVAFALKVMRDAEEPTKMRLAACKTILDLAIPNPKPTTDLDGAGPQLRFLEVVFVRPDEGVIEAKDRGNGHFAVTFSDGD